MFHRLFYNSQTETPKVKFSIKTINILWKGLFKFSFLNQKGFPSDSQVSYICNNLILGYAPSCSSLMFSGLFLLHILKTAKTTNEWTLALKNNLSLAREMDVKEMLILLHGYKFWRLARFWVIKYSFRIIYRDNMSTSQLESLFSI